MGHATGEPARNPRVRTWRPNFTPGSKAWDPARVGQPGYPRTEESWTKRREAAVARANRLHAEGRFHRRGVPDGWAGRKEELAARRADLVEAARPIARSLFGHNSGMTRNDERAEMALAVLIAIMQDPATTDALRTSAARVVLAFTKGAPARGAGGVLKDAKALLAAVTKGLAEGPPGA